MLERNLGDHENRLRVVESWKDKVFGIGILIALELPVCTAILVAVIKAKA